MAGDPNAQSKGWRTVAEDVPQKEKELETTQSL